jgi:hypothetical protein
MNIPLTFASGLYDRMQPLYTREVRPEGIDLNFLAIEAPRVIFDNMARDQAYDPTQCRRLTICRFACISFTRISSWFHQHQPQSGYTLAQGLGRQTHRRAAVHHDSSDLDARTFGT